MNYEKQDAFSVARLRVFSCKCFIHNNIKKQLKAFDSKTIEGRFFVYAQQSYTYLSIQLSNLCCGIYNSCCF